MNPQDHFSSQLSEQQECKDLHEAGCEDHISCFVFLITLINRDNPPPTEEKLYRIRMVWQLVGHFSQGESNITYMSS